MRYTVIGAGHGGQALAAFLAVKGENVILYNRTSSVIDELKKIGKIHLCGAIEADADNIVFTDSLKYALDNSNIIIVSIPANAHSELAENMIPFLKGEHIVILHPGRTLGAYYFYQQLDKRLKDVPIIAELDTFILTSRKLEIGVSQIFYIKQEVHIAAINKGDTLKIYKEMKNIFPMLYPAESICYTSFSNIGVIFHPLPTLLNLGKIENAESFLHYKQGITPTIAEVLTKLDSERLNIAAELGTPILSAVQWIRQVYGSKGSCLYELIQNTEAYNKVYAPKKIISRYIFEDITTGIVPMYCIAKELNLKRDILKLILDLADELYGYDFIANGRNEVKNFLENVHRS